MNYESDIVLGFKYEETATGRIGTATAINFRFCESASVKLEWRDNDQLREVWVAAGRLSRYTPESNGDTL